MTYAMTPTNAPAVQGTPGNWLQFQQDGANRGDANVAVLDIVGDPEELLVTRGVGVNSHVVTIRRIAPPYFQFLDTFTGGAGTIVGHAPDIAPPGFAWSDNSPGVNLLLDGSGRVRTTDTAVTAQAGASAMVLPTGNDFTLELDVDMDTVGADSVSTVQLFVNDFNTGYNLSIQVQRVLGGTFNAKILGGLTGSVLGIAAAGLHSFVLAVNASGAVLKMDGATIITAVGAANILNASQVTLQITNTDATLDHRVSRIAITPTP